MYADLPQYTLRTHPTQSAQQKAVTSLRNTNRISAVFGVLQRGDRKLPGVTDRSRKGLASQISQCCSRDSNMALPEQEAGLPVAQWLRQRSTHSIGCFAAATLSLVPWVTFHSVLVGGKTNCRGYPVETSKCAPPGLCIPYDKLRVSTADRGTQRD